MSKPHEPTYGTYNPICPICNQQIAHKELCVSGKAHTLNKSNAQNAKAYLGYGHAQCILQLNQANRRHPMNQPINHTGTVNPVCPWCYHEYTFGLFPAMIPERGLCVMCNGAFSVKRTDQGFNTDIIEEKSDDKRD